jgi:hypothetical protein
MFNSQFKISWELHYSIVIRDLRPVYCNWSSCFLILFCFVHIYLFIYLFILLWKLIIRCLITYSTSEDYDNDTLMRNRAFISKALVRTFSIKLRYCSLQFWRSLLWLLDNYLLNNTDFHFYARYYSFLQFNSLNPICSIESSFNEKKYCM